MSDNPYEPQQDESKEDPKPQSTLHLTLLILAVLTIVVLLIVCWIDGC